jgi:hypothetical protein
MSVASVNNKGSIYMEPLLFLLHFDEFLTFFENFPKTQALL